MRIAKFILPAMLVAALAGCGATTAAAPATTVPGLSSLTNACGVSITSPAAASCNVPEAASEQFGSYCMTTTEWNNIVTQWNALTPEPTGGMLAWANKTLPTWSAGLSKAQTADLKSPPCPTA